MIIIQVGFHGRSIFPGPGVEKFFFDIGAVGGGQCIFISFVGVIKSLKGVFADLTVSAFHEANKTAVGHLNRAAVFVVD